MEDKPQRPPASGGLMKPRGDFRTLLTYQKAEIIYDLTYYFAHAHLGRGDRTVDQMVQAARSGKQNIAEASAASVTSKETEIKLTNVAKASLIELLVDYEDYLRVRNHQQWEKGGKEVEYLRRKARDTTCKSDYYLAIAKTRPAETVANMCICFLHQADYLLQKQLEALERKFLQEGGFKENMFAARSAARYGRSGTTGNPGNSGSGGIASDKPSQTGRHPQNSQSPDPSRNFQSPSPSQPPQSPGASQPPQSPSPSQNPQSPGASQDSRLSRGGSCS